MPTPEEVQARLKQFKDAGAVEATRSRLLALPAELAGIGIAFLDELSSYWNDGLAAKRLEAKRKIEAVSGNDRRRIFKALFPDIAEHVEASWQLQMKLPFQIDYSRKAFRAPRHPEYTANARIDWLEQLVKTVATYRYDLDFLLVWAAHVGWNSEAAIGLLLGGVLSSDHPARQETFDKLVTIVNGEHETARIGRYAVTALLCSSRPEAWEVVERLLLAAQRQEGLRQVVLESIDFADRYAFVRMLRLIGREKLSRFAAVARAVAVWFGLLIDSAETKAIDRLIVQTVENLEDPQTLDARIASAKGESLYLALWARAFNDVTIATEEAVRIAREPDFERRYAAVHFLTQLRTPPAIDALRESLLDLDLRVAVKAAEVIYPYSQWTRQALDSEATFAALEDLIPRMPRDQVLPPAIWDWNRIHAKQADVVSKLIANRGDRSCAELAQYVPVMDADGRRALLTSMKVEVEKRKSLAADERELALSLLSDVSNGVRQEAFQILGHASVNATEAEAIEPLLARKASDLRRGVIRLLLKQTVADCRASVQRLASSNDALMKQAADEIRSELEPKSVPAASLQDGLGLFDPARRTPPVALSGTLASLMSPHRDRILLSLDALVDQHRETSFTRKGHNGEDIHELFGNVRWWDHKEPDFPLSTVWNEWWSAQRSESRDGVELALALCTVILLPEERTSKWVVKTSNELIPGIDLKFRYLVRDVLWHLLIEHSTDRDVPFLLDALETYLCRVSVNYSPDAKGEFWSHSWRPSALSLLMRVIESCRVRRLGDWTKEHWTRYWSLLRWVDEGISGQPRELPPLEVTLTAHQMGVASDADLYEQLLAGAGYGAFLSAVTRRKPDKLFEQFPELAKFASSCRERVLQVELTRGDLPTAASPAALNLAAVFGARLAVQLLKHLGKDTLSRGYLRDSQSKSVVLSHLLRVCLPFDGDTPESFSEHAKELGVSKKRLVDLALYAPQWAPYSERATGIAGLEEAAHWLHAHTKDDQWTVDQQIRELWFAEVSERTALPRQELLDGAVDVEWFRRMRARLSDADWSIIFDSAKYASGGGGHRRAQLFAAAIAGKREPAELSALVTEKRDKDAVRALGLLPLPGGEPQRRREVLQRYQILQAFFRLSKTFGAMRQASEKLAYVIGLTNLARTAGYADPQRLSWAMETEEIADLKAGPVEATHGGVRAILSINAVGEPELAFEKNGKPLKDLPASARKSASLVALRGRKTQLAQQSSRMRLSLEEAMIRGDRFTPEEVRELAEHPLLRRMVASLLFSSEKGEVRWHADLDGLAGPLRIAHPVDLLNSGAWPTRQRECIEAQRVQPFKQAFRELYVATVTERSQKTHSARYEGNQVNPKQALALIGKRGWVNVPDEGLRRTFHHDNLSVWVTFLEGWFTPAEVDGLTVEHVFFTNRSDGKLIPLEQVNPRVFSEAMRDLDLMVSIAHRGGVDPETSASTIEMRTALLKETLPLLKIQNVRLSERHAFVDGTIGNYNIHLGSGIVHRQPGGSLCIIPVHSQHRGRLFLPFADNDPKTAEIMSKVLLLAQDDQIKDPTILEQLR